MENKLPIGIQDFADIIEGNCLYADKTSYIHRLLQSPKGYYFLSRPRRFGKSLFLSTLKYFFEGRKELFKGLYIEDKVEWKSYPVIYLSFSSIAYETISLREGIQIELAKIARKYEISLSMPTIGLQFRELIEKLYEKYSQKVVILVDEYDKPLVDYVFDQEEKVEAHRKVLREFYSVIKDSGTYLHFLFITGISKFSKVSLFSDLKHLDDISLNPNYGAICGLTQAELENVFEEEIISLQNTKQLDMRATLDKIKFWYNGYYWGGKEKVYNPFSVLNLFSNNNFTNYWFSTGTPTFLVNWLKKENTYYLEGIRTSSSTISGLSGKLTLVPLLFQAGYLTIKGQTDDIYTLGYPNKEVETSLDKDFFDSHLNRVEDSGVVAYDLANHLKADDIPSFIETLNALFADLPYQLFQKDSEAYYHSLTHIMLRLMGVYVQSEVNTSKGRLDAVIQTDTHIYILEFKLNQSAEEALAQIKARNYPDKYRTASQSLVAVGINFSSESKEIADYVVEDLIKSLS